MRLRVTTMLALAVLPALIAGQDPTADEPETTPPIDCPLHAQGVDTHDMRPFAEVEQYIAFLERSDRAAWQKPDAVIRALDLTGAESVADVGAGSGYFSFRLAAALPGGKVRAIDIEPEMVRHVHHRVLTEEIPNLEVTLTESADPGVDPGIDLVFICDVLHHVQNRRAWLGRLHDEMRSGARLVLIEFKEGELPEGPPESLKIPKRELLEIVLEAGFDLSADRVDLLPYQHFLIFSKPQPQQERLR